MKGKKVPRSQARVTLLEALKANRSTTDKELISYIKTQPYRKFFRGIKSVLEMEQFGLPLDHKQFYVILLQSPSGGTGHWVALIRGYGNCFIHFSSYGEAIDRRVQAYINHFLHQEKVDKSDPTSTIISASEDLQRLTGPGDAQCGPWILYVLDHLLGSGEYKSINTRFREVLSSFTMDGSDFNMLRLQKHFERMANNEKPIAESKPTEGAKLSDSAEVEKRGVIEQARIEMVGEGN